jgi:hypothetical protein
VKLNWKKLNWKHFFLLFPLCALIAWCVGCGEDIPSTDDSNDSKTAHTQATNAPPTLSGISYSFTVTASHNFAEEFNSGYVIDFETPTTCTFHPSPQNNRQLADQQGNYSYDRRSGVVQLVSVSPATGQAIQVAMTFITPTTGSAHLTGPDGQTQDVVFVQIAP